MEVILYILLVIGGLYVLANIADYIIVKIRISKRGNKYISFKDFNTIVQAFPFNKEKRYITYFKILDPLTHLLLEACGYNCDNFKTYNKWEKSITKIADKYVYNSDFNYDKKMNREEMLEYLDSDKFDTFSNWGDFPQFVIGYVLDINSNYDEENPITKEDLEKAKIKLQDEAIKERIFSNKKLKEHILLKIEAIKIMIKETQKESEISYLEINLQLAELALRNAEIKEKHDKIKLMRQYN